MPRLPIPSDTEAFSEETRAAVSTMKRSGALSAFTAQTSLRMHKNF